MTDRGRWFPAYVGLGSNLDDPLAQLRVAVGRLGQLARTRLVAASGVYRSKPMGPQDQPDFLNAAAGLLTQLEPAQLLRHLQDIELSMGRRRDAQRWGPRIIDLDLLAYASVVQGGDSLTLPHAGVHERSFVLYPLADIAPALEIAGRGRVGVLAAACPGHDLERLGDSLLP